MAETLLLADANPTMQRVVELTCAEQGLKVVSVSDGQQALDYLVTERPALALISLTLQKLDGFEIASLVRDRPDLQGIPVLLLAGAFETIDEARVRASGAAGVLVKPFEPGLVIKRVKELLGMSKPADGPASARPSSSQSGRFVTSAEAPLRTPDGPAEEVEPPPPSDRPLRKGTETAGSWEQLREVSGLGPHAAAVETSDGGEDYFGKLDAAFESLDEQLAGRSAPSGRVSIPAPPPRIPVAIDPERRPTPPGAPANLYDQLAAHPQAPRPAFEVDEDWFGKGAASRVTREDPHDVAGVHQDAPTTLGAQGTAGAHSAPRAPDSEAVASAIDWRALHDDAAAPSADGTASEGELGAASGRGDIAAAIAADMARERLPATYGEMAPPPTAFPAAEAFALLWAHEQGEPLPPVAAPPPMEWSDQTVEAVARRLSDQLTDRVSDTLTSRVTEGLAARITDGLSRRMSRDVEQRFGDPFAEQLIDGIASRLGAAVSDRLSERLSIGLAEQIAAHVADRMMQHAFGDSLRQTVHDVSERLVREEIARIRAAAKDSLHS